MYRNGPGNWSDIEAWGQPGEIAWQIGVFNGTAYAASYIGNHYSITNRPNISVYLNVSHDGWHWAPADPDHPLAYKCVPSTFTTYLLLRSVLFPKNCVITASGFTCICCADVDFSM